MDNHGFRLNPTSPIPPLLPFLLFKILARQILHPNVLQKKQNLRRKPAPESNKILQMVHPTPRPIRNLAPLHQLILLRQLRQPTDHRFIPPTNSSTACRLIPVGRGGKQIPKSLLGLWALRAANPCKVFTISHDYVVSFLFRRHFAIYFAGEDWELFECNMLEVQGWWGI